MRWASWGLEGTACEGGGGVDFSPCLAALALQGAGGEGAGWARGSEPT